MSDHNSTSYAAIVPVLTWLPTTDWLPTYLEHTQEFYEELSNAIEAPAAEIVASLPSYFETKAVQASFEDFLTTEYDGTPSNALDQYLDEVGMDLKESDIDFLIRFRKSTVRIYKVVARTPGKTVELWDVLVGTKPILIEDERSTCMLSAGDIIATRIVSVDDRDQLAGVVFLLSMSTVDTFMNVFQQAVNEQMRGVEKYLRNDLRQKNLAKQRVLVGAAAPLAGMWLSSVIEALEDVPQPIEDEGDSFFKASLACHTSLESIAETLDKCPELLRICSPELVWAWCQDRSTPEARMKGEIWLGGADIVVEGPTLERVEDAVAMLQSVLAESIGEPEYVDMVALMESAEQFDEDEDDYEDDDDESGLSGPLCAQGSDEDDVAYRTRIHRLLDEAYRGLVNTQVPELGDQRPQELVATAKGRKQLVKWILSIEAQLATSSISPFNDYDLTWMWKELGVESLRQGSLFE